jgi:hypothetical protein
MTCVPSTYNASGELAGCTAQDLSAIITAQLYAVFALGTGLYLYKSLTAENWADIAVQIGWGCVSAFTHAKRFAVRYVIPGIYVSGSFVANRIASLLPPDTDSDVEDDHHYVRVVKDGVELQSHSSIFKLIQCLTDSMDPAQDSDGGIDVLSEDEPTDGQESPCDEPEPEPESESESESETSHGNESIREELARIENHGVQFDFIMCQVPTLQTSASDNPMRMHVMKYDGFPRESDGSYFFDRKFVPVDHRMMEIVLQCDGAEHELDLSSPDNFYVIGNKLLDPAFLKWFMRKNHGVILTECNYTIKCIDHNATLHTLSPCKYVRVSETGFEIQDSGLI